jgi:hypothetical protein
LSHFPQQSGILTSDIDKSSNSLCHSWWNWWRVGSVTPVLGSSSTIISMSTGRRLL